MKEDFPFTSVGTEPSKQIEESYYFICRAIMLSVTPNKTRAFPSAIRHNYSLLFCVWLNLE